MKSNMDPSRESLEDLYQRLSEVEAEIEERRVPRCVMILDISGYTAYVDRNGDVAGRRLIRLTEEEIAPIVQAHGGRILKGLGDGWLVSFLDPNRGTQASIEIQRTFSSPDRVEAPELKVALDYGKLLDESDDVFGNVVNTCSRLVDLCERRQILVSESVYASVDPFYRALCSPYIERKIRGKPDKARTYSVRWRGPSPGAGGKEARQGHILEIRWNGDRGQISFMDSLQQTKPLTSYVEYDLDLPQIEECAKRIHELIGRNSPSAAHEEISNDLKSRGESLFGLLFPEPIARAIKQCTSEFLILSLDDSCVHIPWELAHDGVDFLCCRFSIGRLARTSQSADPASRPHPVERFKMLVLSNPSEDLPAATEEGRYLYDLCRPDSRVEFEWLNGSVIDSKVREILGNFDVVHYCGHAEFSADKPDESGWLLGKDRLSAGDLETFANGPEQAPLLVFNNACHSGTTGSWKTAATGWSYGLANAFLLAGCHHYIGAHSELIDLSSKEFAKTFYRHIIAGRPIGSALKRARLEVREKAPSGSLTWAQYIHYGDPAESMFQIDFDAIEQTATSEGALEWDEDPMEEREPVGAAARLSGEFAGMARGHGRPDAPEPAGAGRLHSEIKGFPLKNLAGFSLLACVMVVLLYWLWRPSPPTFDLKLIYLLSRSGNVRDAMRLFNESGIGAETPEAEAYAALFALDSGDWDKAREAADSRLAGRPGDPLSQLILARIRWSQDENEEAEAALQSLLEQSGTENWQRAEAWRILGRIALAKGDLEGAIASYEKAAGLEEEDPLLYVDRGLLYTQAGNLDAARAAYGKALALDPNDVFVAEMYEAAEKKLKKQARDEEWDGIVESLERLDKALAERGPQEIDPWTSRPLTIAFENFELLGPPFQRLGESDRFELELTEALRDTGRFIVVPPWYNRSGQLRELELGVSALADPQQNLETGRLLAARISLTSKVLRDGGETEVFLQARDNEPGAFVANPTQETTGEQLSSIVPALADALTEELLAKYPLRGRIASASGAITLNIGALHGVRVGDVFDVYPNGEGGMVQTGKPVGQVRVVEIQEFGANCEGLIPNTTFGGGVYVAVGANSNGETQ